MATSTPTPQVRFGIRKKLFFLTLIAFTLLILVTSWQIGVQANKVANKTIAESLRQARVVLDTKIDSRYLAIAETANGIARDGRVLPLVFEGESLTLQDLSLEFQKALAFDMLFFTDAEGRILARSDRPEAIGHSLAGRSPLFDEALRGNSSRGVFVSGDSFLQIVVVPVFDNLAKDVVRGSVGLAYEFSAQLAQEIQALSASDVSFFVFRRNGEREIDGVETRQSTHPARARAIAEHFNQHPELWQNIAQAETDTTMNLSLGDDLLAIAFQRLNNPGGAQLGFVMTSKSRQELLAPFHDIQRTVIIIGLVCLVVAVCFAWVFAARLSRPIVSLVAITRNIQEGNYDTTPLQRVSHDEVGLLYEAVVKMGSALKDKAELESYLAQMSSELDASESAAMALTASELDQHFSQTTAPTLQNTAPTAQRVDTLGSNDATLAHLPELDQVSSSFSGVVDKRYRILRHIGAGAIGTVYLAHDMSLDENVAIKMMPARFFSQQDSLNVKEEIRLARKITHRNVLRTFDFGEWENYYYITMEYVAGYDLGMLLKSKGALQAHIGVTMAKQICSAMNAAHEQGIIHRDLKPSNMMINRQGILKIMDFGLAMKVNKRGDKDQGNERTRGDATTIAGTPRYMAPEQFFNWPLDERTDIYAIGVILYAIFSGAPPFNAKDIQAFAELHLKEIPKAIGTANGPLSPALNAVIFKALAKKPEDRYQSVREILDDLNALS